MHPAAGASALALLLSLLPACTSIFEDPAPDPLELAPPAAPQAKPGEIRIFGHRLPAERARAIRSRLRRAEGEILAKYEEILATDKYAGGLLQVRVDINSKGEVADVKGLEVDLNNLQVGREADAILEKTKFAPGAEAYAFHTMQFVPDPFEVLGIRTDFDAEHPILVADVLNRTAFHLRNVAVIVRVQSPDKAAPLRVSRVRMRAPFEPGARRTLRVPVKSEWASERYTFLVDVRPSADVSGDDETE